MSEINFQRIEKKWQKKWESGKAFVVSEKSKKKKFYNLEMFPYPSGEGLHMGHALNYTIGDIFARFKRMSGFNVLYPMGYDSFGLPAENAAIKAKTHPRAYTRNAIKNFVMQQRALGISYDWSRMLSTSEESYYKWNQFLFLKLMEAGLVYRKKAPVNWCPKCRSVLANEQVHNGKCWRHEDTDVETKQLEQWFIKTTAYADELLDCIDDLKWPERIKTMQKNWIGKSFGTEIDFEIESGGKISNVVIVHGSNVNEEEAREVPLENERHWKPWLKKELEKRGVKASNELYPEDWLPNYEKWKKVFERNKINENSVLVGHSAGTAFLLRWLSENKKKIKKLILIAPSIIKADKYLSTSKLKDFKFDSSLRKYFDEIVMFYSDDDDEYIIKSAKKIHKIIGGRLVEFKGKGHFLEFQMKTKDFPELLDEILSTATQKFPIFTTRPDTIYGVTFMVISAQHPKLWHLVTDEQEKEVEKFLKKIKSTKQEDIDLLDKEGVFTGSYAINPVTNERIPIWAGNFVIADYGSGMVMAVPAHDQRDFEFAKKYGIEIKQVIGGKITKDRAFTGEDKLINSDKFNGMNNRDAIVEITKFLEKKKLGRKQVQFKLRDWLISRQRYWGTPIPIVYCDKCGAVPVSEKDLPVKLPEKVEFGKGNPLTTNEKFLNCKCPKCGMKARRETDTMDTFFDSSWYYLRYADNENAKKVFDKKKVDYWLPVDQYIGGAEHACMHLIYARFFTKALRDLGFVNFDEPFTKLFNQGMLHAEDGNKMSKSLGNVINPIETIKKYSADSLRLALMSFASPDKDTNWDEKVLIGSHKFLKRVGKDFEKIKIGNSSARIESKLNKTIKEVTTQIENFKYNLAIIKIRDLFNSFGNEESKEVLEKSLKLLHPFCPHITEELWEKLSNKDFISLSEWPKIEEKKIDESLDKQDELVKKLKQDIEQIKKLTGKQGAKVYVYVLPNELEIYKSVEGINLFAVNDKKKYDPENKSKKVKPNKPGIYLE